MTAFVGRHVAPEMIALSLIEACLSFYVSYALLVPGGYDGTLNNSAASHALVVAAALCLTSCVLGMYRPQLFLQTRNLLLKTAVGGVAAFPIVWVVSAAMGISSEWLVGPDRAWPTKDLIAWIAALFAVRMGFLLAVRSKLFVRKIAVYGPVGQAAKTVSAIRTGRAGFFDVIGIPQPGEGTAAELKQARIRTVLMPAGASQAMPDAVKAAFLSAGVSLEPETEFWERRLRRIDIDHLAPAWFTLPDRRALGGVEAAVQRGGDILLSLALLAFTFPLMLAVALLVRLDSPGPVLYRQERVGLDGRCFVLLKFRSMNCNAEARGPAWAQRRDPRVTRVGSLMRRTRIDELPQLLNVLRGQMSFIGPRPERPHFVEQLAALIPHYQERARVKPGLTGWAQVNYPYGASVEDARAKLSYDLFYVKNRTLVLDLLILFATIRVILFQEGAR